MNSGIYLWKLNGIPKYVGQGLDVEKRMKNKHYECKVLLSAINKYGFDSFEKEIICYCEPDEMGDLEIYYIKDFHTHVSEGGYNISWGGDTPMLGRKHSEEARKKISKANKGIPKPTMRGRKLSDEHKLKLSLSGIGNSNALGSFRNDEIKKIIGESGIGRKLNRSTSKYFGVCFNKEKNKWQCYFKHNKEMIRVGRFKTELEAAIAYDNYVIENNLDRPLNFPDGG